VSFIFAGVKLLSKDQKERGRIEPPLCYYLVDFLADMGGEEKGEYRGREFARGGKCGRRRGVF